MKATASAPEPQERVLVIERSFDAPRALVFKAWSEPEHLVRWWGPAGYTLPSCELDCRPGGVFRCVMRSPEGNETRLQCEFREVSAPERLVFTWAWLDEDGTLKHETLVTLNFEEQGEKTKLTLHQEVFESVSARDMHEGGWTGCLDSLGDYLASL